jgi:hypothetical protein
LLDCAVHDATVVGAGEEGSVENGEDPGGESAKFIRAVTFNSVES